MDFEYVAVDVETTGLNSEADEVVEVVAIEFNMAGTLGKRFISFCRPLRGLIPTEVVNIHGITYEMVKTAKAYLTEGVREEVATFIGTRTVIGHNIDGFDLAFLKIKPTATRDTLKMCRARYSGSNKLKTACTRVGIAWDNEKAHRAEYDTEKTIELFLKIKSIEDKEASALSVPPLIEAMMRQEPVGPALMGVIPSEQDKQMLATQAYSYSRINLFHQCPFKWYMKYVRKMREPDYPYFQIGKICHRVAELANELCVRTLFANKFEAYVHKVGANPIPVKYAEAVRVFEVNGKISTAKAGGMFLFDHRGALKEVTGMGYANFTHIMDQTLDEAEYEKPSMPDRKDYEYLINKTVAEHKCDNGMVISEVMTIMWRFYDRNDFTLYPGEISVTEQRLAFDKSWNLLDDFYASNVFFRGIIDVIDYSTGMVTITDYKTSRKMMSASEMKNDMQLKLYLMCVYMMLPKDTFTRAIIRVNYVRYNVVVQIEIEDVKAIVDAAIEWINASIQAIEKEMMKSDGTSFSPIRNEYCHSCFLGEDGLCPLFNKQFVGSIDDPMSFVVSDIDACQKAWKRVEADKAEISRLTKQCKTFISSCDAKIAIDDKATLDFWVEHTRSYDPVATMMLLKGKGIDGTMAMKFFSIPRTALEKLLEIKKVILTQEEIDSISSVSTKSSFDAFTPEEASSKGFLNS